MFKIEQILNLLHSNIKENLTNFEIFNLFKNNKRIILFLISEQILIIDDFLIDKMKQKIFLSKSYFNYFSNDNEIKHNNEDKFKEPNIFESKCKIGENDNFLCELIRKD